MWGDARTLIAVADLELGKVGRQLCDAAFNGIIEKLLEGYVVIGGTAAGQGGAYKQSGGVDFVWDLWNEQFSAFTYPEHLLSSDSLAGAAAGVHFGFGFGRFDGVHSAWSGTFYGTEYTVNFKAWNVLSVSGSVQGFSSPDGTMVGGLVGIGGSASVPNSVTKLLKLPLGGSITAGGGVWTPHDRLTSQLTPASRSRDLESSGRHRYLDLSEGELGVGSHMLHVMGITPLSLSVASYAVAVAMAKRHAEDKGIRNRAQALRDLHLTLCSLAYRQISTYKSDVPSGHASKNYGDYTVQRSKRGNYIITTTSKAATGEWRTTRRLHKPDATVIDAHRYWMATGGAPNGFINGRSYSMMKFSQEIGRLQEAMMRR